MSAAIDFSKYVKGEPVKVVVWVSREKLIKRWSILIIRKNYI